LNLACLSKYASTGTEESVIEALNEIYENIENFDVVAIIRGGGSKAIWAISTIIICLSCNSISYPCYSRNWTRRDESVTDMVAHTKLKHQQQ